MSGMTEQNTDPHQPANNVEQDGNRSPSIIDNDSLSSLSSVQSYQAQAYYETVSMKSRSRRGSISLRSNFSQERLALTKTLSKRLTSIRDTVRADNEISERERRDRIDLEVPDVLDYITDAKSIDGTTPVRRLSTSTESRDIEHDRKLILDTLKKDDDDDGPTDGGYGWVCCICYLFLAVSTWGANASYGVFLAYYLDSDVFPGATANDFAFIGGFVIGISQIIAPFTLIISKIISMRACLILGTILQTAAYLLASFSTKIWQLYLTQGFLLSIAFSLIFFPSVTINAGWFLKKRALAGGIGAAGAGLGGLIYSLSCNKLFIETGDQRWPLRMTAIVSCFTCTICLILIKERKKPAKSSIKASVKAVLDVSIIKSLPINIISVFYAMDTLAYIILIFSLSAYGRSVAGLSASQSSNLTVIVNLGQCVGRPSIGLLSDRFGRINCGISFSIVTAILILAFWINAKSYATLLAFSFLSGSTAGVGAVLFQTLAADSVAPAQIPAAFSQVSILTGISTLFAEVIGLNLRNYDISNPYLYCQIFAGLCYVVGGCTLFLLRERRVRSLIKLRRERLEEELSDADKEITDMKDVLRLEHYDTLLNGGIRGYVYRTFYPIIL